LISRPSGSLKLAVTAYVPTGDVRTAAVEKTTATASPF
jgi:hypothetical protein